MNSKDVLSEIALTATIVNDNKENAALIRSLVRVREVPERDRRRLLMHFLALDEGDRLLRFGVVLSDEMITRYVQHLDFGRDTIFGVYNDKLNLVGVGHLAFAPRGTLPLVASIASRERVAEFGVSVSEIARGMGVGTKLFKRAAMHCRNENVDTLYMHCLASNQTMMHIAKKAGMQIHRDQGEADAYLKLTPANSMSILQEAEEERAANVDYAFKANSRVATHCCDT